LAKPFHRDLLAEALRIRLASSTESGGVKSDQDVGAFACERERERERPADAAVDSGRDQFRIQMGAGLARNPTVCKFQSGNLPSGHFVGSQFDCWENSMEQAFRQNAQVDLVEPSVPGISWAAVLAGAVASLALTLVLLTFGAGMGFSVVSPWGNSGVSATTFKIGTGLYFIVMAMISSAMGGYLAGRLRTKWVGVQTTEVHFRDTAHGFLAWAAASVIGAVLLASPASSLVGGTLAGATQGAANAAQSSPMSGYVDTLLRSDNPSAQGQQNPSDPRGEMVRLFTTSFHNGSDLIPPTGAMSPRSYRPVPA
jgi:hypothetical protein